VQRTSRPKIARHWCRDYLAIVGRQEEALVEAKLAFELDPLSPMINTWLGLRYYHARRYDEAIEQGRKIPEFDPKLRARSSLAWPGISAERVARSGNLGIAERS
jgi:tetratricopeptide (TPR) repeat protein